MSKEVLGKIEKPSFEEYKKYAREKKLYLVPLFVQGERQEVFQEYKNKLRKYWKQVEMHLTRLEEKIGKVKKIYCEMVDKAGEEGAKAIKEMDDILWHLVKSLLDKGAQIRCVEDPVLLQEYFDWIRCLSLRLSSAKVSSIIRSFFSQNLRARDRYISKAINDDLKSGEIGILFVREHHSLEFASDIDVFKIFPPALSEVRHYLEKMRTQTA